MNEPLGQRGAAVALGMRGWQLEARGQSVDRLQCARPNLLLRLLHVAPIEHVNGARLAAARPCASKGAAAGMNGANVGDALRRQLIQSGFHVGEAAVHVRKGGFFSRLGGRLNEIQALLAQ